jgi:hypothetical protein
MKRFRDKNGELIISIAELARITLDEANAYYINGERYRHKGKTYTFHRYYHKDANGNEQEIVRFTSDDDDDNLFVVPNKLGTWLPDVASKGMEIVKEGLK